MSDTGARGSSRARLPSPDEWRRLEPLVDRLLDEPPETRAALLDTLAGDDPVRRDELARLVAECEHAYPPLDRQATERFADVAGADSVPIPGTIADRYTIVREVGRGGMATVYLARDVRHGRDVAVKVVRPALAAAMGRERFLREIEIAAGLRHPHIVPLYDSGEIPIAEPDAPGAALLYYVMPYEAGQSLRALLAHERQLSVESVVGIMRDVCEALAHAHGRGIVHRDIKPDNVLLSGGHAVVTDFGIARAAASATVHPTNGTGGAASDTAAFGTPAYMAPEQVAHDRRVDHRADLWALGVMAFELLAGHPPFGDTRHGPPDSRDVANAMGALARSRPDTPAALLDVIARCIAPHPEARWPGADALLLALARVGSAPEFDSTRVPSGHGSRNAAIVAGSVATLVLVMFLVLRARGDRALSLDIGRSVRLTSEPGLEMQPALSPDGRRVAFAVGNSLRTRVAVRSTAGGPSTTLTDESTGSAWQPRWSPDGARVLFLARGGAYSAPPGGGVMRQEIEARGGTIVSAADWSPDGREIAYVRGDSLFARAVSSGRTRVVATGHDLHSCRWSPDSRWLACVSGNAFHVTARSAFGVGPMFGNLAPSRIVLVPAAGGAATSITDSGSLHQSPVWSRDGRTLYYVSSRDGPRDIHAIDVSTRAPSATGPTRVTTGMNPGSFDLSRDGARIVYARYESTANAWAIPIPTIAPGSQPVSPESALQITTGNQTVEGVRVSLDGRWLVYDSDLNGSSDIYRVPVTGGEPERLTRGASDEFRGTLSPDGGELAYHSFQTGSRNIFLRSLATGETRQLTRSPGQLAMANWSPDGSALSLFDMGAARVLVMRRDARGGWSAPRYTGARGWRAEWAPDGRTLAFVSPSDGRIGLVSADSGTPRDLYVPGDGDPLAELAIFSPNGRELYFKSHDALGRASFWSILLGGGRPRLLVRFDDPARSSNRFDFASDGRRFYFTMEDRQSDLWIADVARR